MPFPLGKVHTQMKLFMIISMGSYITATTDNIFCIHQILEKEWKYNETVRQLFIDFKKATVQHSQTVWCNHETNQADENVFKWKTEYSPYKETFLSQFSHPIWSKTRRCFITTLIFALEYAIRKVHKNQVRLKLNTIHQLLAYTDDDTLLGNNIDTIRTKKRNFNDVSKETGLEINIEKTKYILLCCHPLQFKIMTWKQKTVWKCVTVHIFGSKSNK
jgi:hypothetical protein